MRHSIVGHVKWKHLWPHDRAGNRNQHKGCRERVKTAETCFIVVDVRQCGPGATRSFTDQEVGGSIPACCSRAEFRISDYIRLHQKAPI